MSDKPDEVEEKQSESTDETIPADQPEQPEPSAAEDDSRETAETESSEKTTPADSFDDALLARAKLAGLDETTAKAYGEPAHLRRTLDVMNQRFAQVGEQQLRSMRAPQSGAPTVPPAPAAAPPPPPTPPSAPVAPSAYKPALDKDQYGDEIVQEFSTLHNTVNQNVEQVKMAVGALYNLIRQQTAAPAEREWREAHAQAVQQFGNLADQLNEPALLEKAYALQAGYASSGLQPPSPRELHGYAMQLVHADLLRQVDQERLKGELAEREKQILEQPTGRKPRKLSGDERAAEYAERKAKELVGAVGR